MEFQTISQVSKTFGISRRMLCYYEEIGLLESLRKDDYAYRVYDETSIKRLQQIIILRKLQIPMKQIKEILENQDAVEIIEIFKQNISELDEQITALSTVRSILSRFVDELQEKADMHLKLDLLSDKAMLAVVNTLSFSENKLKEKLTMEELNKASEILEKEKEKNMRIVYRPPATIAFFADVFIGGTKAGEKSKTVIDTYMKKFIKETNLFKLKPDMRVFTFGDGNRDFNGNIWVTIPDDLDVPAPFEKRIYPGGFYAAYTNKTADIEWTDDLEKWVKNNDDYEWFDDNGLRAIGDEYFNPYNIYGLEEENDSDNFSCSYITELFPVRKLKKFTNEEKDKINAKLDKIAPRNEPVKIDLMAMTLQNDDGVEHELIYPKNLMEIKVDNGACGMVTPKQFNYPLKIELRAKTNKALIGISFAQIDIGLQQTGACNLDIGYATETAPGGWDWQADKKQGKLPPDEFVDIEWFLTKEAMAVRVNGELRHYKSDYEFIKEFEKNPEHSITGQVSIIAARGTVTVESLCVTEL